MSLSDYEVTGPDNPTYQISADEWNALLAELSLTANGLVRVTKAELAAIPYASLADGASFWLTDAGIEGPVSWRSIDFVAEFGQSLTVIDFYQGVYFPPAAAPTGASGAFVRTDIRAINPVWFGFSTDATGASNTARLQAVLDLYEYTGIFTSGPGVPYMGGGKVFIPRGIYLMSGPVDVRVNVWIEGETAGAHGGGSATELKWDGTSSGFRVQRINTSGDTDVTVGRGGGDSSSFHNLLLSGGTTANTWQGSYYPDEEGDFHGINFKARIEAFNVYCKNWAGNGFHSHTVAGHGGALEGNSNCWRLYNCIATGCRNGLFLDGADTNAGLSLGFNAASNRQAGIYDGSFLANQHLGFHLDGNGFYGAQSGGSTATYSGNVYTCIPGQEVWCSTNAPSGTSTHNQGWRYHNPGGVGVYGARAWTSGLTWRACGAVITDNANAYHIVEGYSESGQPPAQYAYPTRIGGGQYAGAVQYGSAATTYGGEIQAHCTAGGAGISAPLDFEAGRYIWSIGGQIELVNNTTRGFTGPSQVAFYRDSANGLTILSSDGTSNAFLLAANGNSVMNVPSGSTSVHFYGNVAANGTISASNLSGTNTGDQTSIVGLTGTKAQFNTAVTDGDFLYVGDVTAYTDEQAQDAVGNILTDTATIDFTYNDGANTITADVKDGSITLAKQANMNTASVVYRKTAGNGPPEVQTLATLKTDLGLTGTNSGDQTSIVGITGTKAQFDTAVTDANLVAEARNINTTAPITGGGDLSADLTLAISAATTSNAGSMSATDKAKVDNLVNPVKLSSDGANIGPTIADYFPSTISLEANSVYIVECHAYLQKNTAGTLTWTWAFSSAPSLISSRYQATPVTGFTTTPITGAEVFSEVTVETATTAAFAASASLTAAVRHSFIFYMMVITNAATTMQLRATSSAGTVTPKSGSFMKATKVA